jgi:hypothetical protein
VLLGIFKPVFLKKEWCIFNRYIIFGSLIAGHIKCFGVGWD